ncbi:MAG TPA: alkaline phosphatase family protein [Terracidiphilus sp.]|nr:alkaline phosphatase family protein [Terracidiphilus sp.]
MSVNRRDFLRRAAGVSAAALATALPDARSQSNPVAGILPEPSASGIEHVVVVMMENRSFDHLLGWMPNANGRQSGLSYPDNNGNLQPTHRLNYYVGCSHPDPDHSYAGGRSEYDNGKMDGWLRTSTNDSFCTGYYEEADLPLFGTLARNFTTLNNYFPSILSSTFPNRVFQHAAQTDRLSNTYDLSTLPTIWDSLLAGGVSCRYYYQNVPFLALWGLNYIGISAFYSQFKLDVAAGTLPAVSFVDPWFTILDDGLGNDDHPHADLRKGEIFLRDVVTTLAASPLWANTVLVINRDEWGGFFDHVVPPRVVAPNGVDTDLVDGKALLGCRVPTLIVSPFARGNPAKPTINSLLYDHTSVLKLIEWRWGLAPLTARDGSDEIANLAYALNFTKQDASLPALPVIAEPPLDPCTLDDLIESFDASGAPVINTPAAIAHAQEVHSKGEDNETYDFYLLLKSDRMQGWPVPASLQAKPAPPLRPQGGLPE